jgi:hypothetical protein
VITERKVTGQEKATRRYFVGKYDVGGVELHSRKVLVTTCACILKQVSILLQFIPATVNPLLSELTEESLVEKAGKAFIRGLFLSLNM